MHQVTKALSVVFITAVIGSSAFHSSRAEVAANGEWSGGGPKAKSIFSITVDPSDPNTIYAGAMGSGVFKSIDGGLSWDPSTTGLTNTYVRAVAIYPQNHSILYAGTNDGVFMSTDAGISWLSSLATSKSVRALAFDPNNADVLYAGSLGEGVFKSSDQGATWHTVNAGLNDLNVRTIACHPFIPNTVLSGTGSTGGVNLSANGGLYWSLTADPDGRGAVSDLEFDPLTPSRVYAAMFDRGVAVSADGGVSWTRIVSGLTSWKSRALAVADTLRYVGTDSAGVFYTSLRAAGWTVRNDGLSNLLIRALATAPGDARTVYAGTDGAGLFKSTDAGVAWSPLNNLLMDTTGRCLLVLRDFAGTVVCGTGFGDGIWTSADGGANWIRSNGINTRNSVLDLVQASDGVIFAAIYATGVYASGDGGSTWASTDTLTLGNRFVRSLSIHPSVPTDMLVGTGDGTYRTTNAGLSWFASNGGFPPAVSVRVLARVPFSPSTVFAGTDSSGVYKSTDGGATWASSSFGLTNLDVHTLVINPTIPSRMLLGSDAGLFRSTDGGASWFLWGGGLPAAPSIRALAYDPTSMNIVYAGIWAEGVYQSHNDGASWTPLNTSLPDYKVYSLVLDTAHSTLYAGTRLRGVFAYTYNIAGAPSPNEDLDAKWISSLEAVPSPARAFTDVRFRLAEAARSTVAIFDSRGTRIRTLSQGWRAAGSHSLKWDGRDESGRALPGGVYWVRLETPAATRSAKLILLP